MCGRVLCTSLMSVSPTRSSIERDKREWTLCKMKPGVWALQDGEKETRPSGSPVSNNQGMRSTRSVCCPAGREGLSKDEVWF